MSCLDSFVKDIVQQIDDANEMLDQRHYRLLLNLPAVEKVKDIVILIKIVYLINVYLSCSKR